MKRPLRITWKHCCGIVLGLAVVIGSTASFFIHSETMRSIREAREQGQAVAAGFAQAAEEYFGTQVEEGIIRVDARQSFNQAVEVILLGTTRYVQVVLGDAVIVDSEDAEWTSSIPLSLSGAMGNEGLEMIHSVEGQLIFDVIVPIGQRHPEAPIDAVSYARVGYEVPGLVSHIHSIRLAGGSIAIAAFVVGLACATLILVRMDYAGTIVSPFNGVIQSFSQARTSGPLVLDEHSKKVTLHGTAVYVPPKPFQLLALLIQENGRVLKEEEIVAILWPEADLADSRDVRQCVYLLRKRLDDTVAGAGACISNVKGFGYCYDAACLEELPKERELAALTDM
jgi:DNA-binding winged helix-turn-helix (wHTH) protein